jgi:hypothetical protein
VDVQPVFERHHLCPEVEARVILQNQFRSALYARAPRTGTAVDANANPDTESAAASIIDTRTGYIGTGTGPCAAGTGSNRAYESAAKTDRQISLDFMVFAR